MALYDVSRKIVLPTTGQVFSQNSVYSSGRRFDTNFHHFRVFKQKTDGAKQYPFVYVPKGTGTTSWSTLDMNRLKEFPMAINAGLFNGTTVTTNMPMGTLIENGEIIQQKTYSGHTEWLLLIDNDGNLSYAEMDADASALVARGIVSAVLGFCPLIVDYAPTVEDISNTGHYDVKGQRQIIGQYGNGDYAIITAEGRGFDNSSGWTLPEAQAVCQELGLKFAYNLDGGGSTETVIGNRQVNTIYENTAGRAVPTYIVFNGLSVFSVPK